MSERTVHLRTCPLCEAMCGLEVHVEWSDDPGARADASGVGDGPGARADASGVGTVKLIRPDREDVWSKGFICPKGTVLGHLYHDPDRLRTPMVRDGDEWREATWPQAFARCEELLHGVLARQGKSAITAYIGNPTAHAFSLSRYVGVLIGMAQLDCIYSAGTVDQWPKNVSSMLLYGGMWTIPTPDLERTDYFVIMGGNPQASGGSLMACADVLAKMDAIRERGGKVIVIDPRRTGTAAHADEWIPIVPGTDAAFLMAVANVLFADGLVDPASIDPLIDGVPRVGALVADWTPERVAATCGIEADTIRRIARELGSAPTAALYGRIGTCNQEFGTLASWLVDVVNVLTGNFDRPGGLMFAKPVAWSVNTLDNPEFADGVTFGRWKSRVGDIGEVLGQVPVGLLAEEILEGGDAAWKALITIAGNPVISSTNPDRLDDALTTLECMISVDNYLNETTRHAHVILPGLAALEQPHFDDLILSWAVRSTGNYSPAIFPPEPGRPEEWQILTILGAMLLGMKYSEIDVDAFDDGFFAALCTEVGVDPALAIEQSPGRGPERLLDLQIRTAAFGDRYGERPEGLTLQSFKDAPHGIDMGPMVPRLAEVLKTPSGRVDLAPDYITADLDRLAARIDRSIDSLLLTSRRHLRSNNSWMHNVKVLVKGKDRCTLLIHPDDARRSGVSDGGVARVSSENGMVEVPVEVSDEMMPGVVSLPHGWGHDKIGARLSVAREHAGVNNNKLADPYAIDVLSNNAAINGIRVEVSPT
jgi:anaerobic selenocysteine-containing dehydrogenase